ncbi:NADH dehydrogenase (ubiquinone) complex I, assembly factor 6 isoform X1 [Procambarus clarkii]|uniref:NADH dehydrogenase (ubiquinone) complex I, assembly factor 6 isoform X1 n=1 Tax=Procambarus clarkii TaxID=6728 RepID=UPI001E672A97|nr:NADH dehydrogenase (ubiquinone) complex I, assembly factor 6-like isoform X1 [Procambarus clarkii]
MAASVPGTLRLSKHLYYTGRPTLPRLKERNRLWTGRMYATREARKAASTTQYCLEVVKQNDYENFLCVLLLPQCVRATAVAIRAFNAELSQVSDMTSEVVMAKMRFQFWRETLDHIYQHKAPRQPVAIELQKAVARHQLSKRWLRSLIDSREDQIDSKQFTSLAAVEDYSEKSNSPLYYLILQGLGIQNLHADHAASHVSKAEGLAKLLRGVPHHGVKRKVFLPCDVMLKHDVSQEEVIRGSKEQKVKDVVYDTASLAHQHLNHARSLLKSVPKDARVCLLPSVAVSTYLNSLQEAHFDVFDTTLHRRNNMIPYSLLWARLCNKY